MTAVFGALFGLATVASIFALLMQVFPVRGERRAHVPTASAGASAAPLVARPAPPKRVRTPLPSPWRLGELKASHRVVEGEMQRRPFTVALEEAKVPKDQIYRVLKAMEGLYKLDRPGAQDRFAVAMARGDKRVAAFEYEVSRTEIYQARAGEDGVLRAERLDLKVREEEFATAFYVGKDLEASHLAAGLEKGLVREMNKALEGRTSTEAFAEGGVVRVVVVEETALGLFSRYARIKALEVRPPDPAEPPVRAYWFDGESTHAYVDDKGRRPSAGGWRAPVPGAPITSHFNPNRLHPLLKKVMPHNGTDYGAPSGTPVYAAYRGEILVAGERGPNGNLVTIRHPGGIETGYAHLSAFAKGIRAGVKVGTRQLVGFVGSTGRSTGPHLHFSAKKDGKYFDPLDLRLDALEVLPVSERAPFLALKTALDQELEAIPLPEPPPPDPEVVAAVGGGDEDAADAEPAGQEAGAEDAPATRDDEESAPAPRPRGGASKGAPRRADDALVGEDLSGDIE
jgi:murein DD-endopeptidase MepM/ murein hydrolase activator NlpD